MKILIAEDEAPFRHVLTKTLEPFNHQIYQAANGNQALELFQIHQPHLMLLDIVMPQKSGYQVLEIIRTTHQSQISIIVISNLDQPQDIQKARQLGATDFIHKAQLNLDDLVAKIHQLTP